MAKRHKSAKKKLVIGARMLKRNPEKLVSEAIEILNSIAGQTKRKPKTKKAAMTMARLLMEAPKTGYASIEKLLQIEAKKGISLSTICRIFASPLAFTTLKRKLKDIANHKGEFKQLLESFESLKKDVQWAYKRKIPAIETKKVLQCKRGEFYRKLFFFAGKHSAPKSFVTDLIISRMQYLEFPAEAIAEAERIKWGMHHHSHNWYAAKKKGNKEAMNRSRRKVRGLNKIFNEKFAKKL